MRGRAFAIAQGSDASARSDTGKARPRQAFGSAAALLGIAAALWSPLVVAACCPGPRVVERPIIIRGPSCLPGPAPVVPEGVEYGTTAWAQVYVETQAWIVATEASCGEHPQPVAVARHPDPGPAWWTRQPSGAVGE